MKKERQFFVIDLSGITERAAFHERLQDALSLPSWYGRNLDALYDVLTDFSDPMSVYFIGWEGLQKADPAYFDCIRRVFRDAESEIPDCSFIFMERFTGSLGQTDGVYRNPAAQDEE